MIGGRGTRHAENPELKALANPPKESKWSLRKLFGRDRKELSESKRKSTISISVPLENPMLQAYNGNGWLATGKGGEQTTLLTHYNNPHTVPTLVGTDKRNDGSRKGPGFFKRTLGKSSKQKPVKEPLPQTPNIRMVQYMKPVRSSSVVSKSWQRIEPEEQKTGAQEPAPAVYGSQYEAASAPPRHGFTNMSNSKGLEETIDSRYKQQTEGQTNLARRVSARLSRAKEPPLKSPLRAERPSTATAAYIPQHAASDFSNMNLRPRFSRAYSSASRISRGGERVDQEASPQSPATPVSPTQHATAYFHDISQTKSNSSHPSQHLIVPTQSAQQDPSQRPISAAYAPQHAAADFSQMNLPVRHSRNVTRDNDTSPYEHYFATEVQPERQDSPERPSTAFYTPQHAATDFSQMNLPSPPYSRSFTRDDEMTSLEHRQRTEFLLAAAEQDADTTDYQQFLRHSMIADKEEKERYSRMGYMGKPNIMQPESSEMMGEIEANYRESLKVNRISMPKQRGSKRASRSGSFFDPVRDYIKPSEPERMHLLDPSSGGETNEMQRTTTAEDRQRKRKSWIAEYVKPSDSGDGSKPSKKYPPIVKRNPDALANAQERQRKRSSWASVYAKPGATEGNRPQLERQTTAGSQASRGSQDKQRKRKSWVAEYIKPSVPSSPQAAQNPLDRWANMGVDSSSESGWEGLAVPPVRASWRSGGTFGNGRNSARGPPKLAGLDKYNRAVSNGVI